MTKIVISLIDSGSVIKIQSITVNKAIAPAMESKAEFNLQLRVNGSELSSDKAFWYLMDHQPKIRVSEADKLFLWDTLRQSLPLQREGFFLEQDSNYLRASANLTNKSLQQHLPYSVEDAYMDVLKTVDDFRAESIAEMAREIGEFRFDSNQLAKLNHLGNRAFKQEFLVRGLQKELLNIGFSKEIFVVAGFLKSLQEEMKGCTRDREGNLETKSVVEAVGMTGLKTAALYKICESTRFKGSCRVIETGIHRALMSAAARLGIASVHPLIATGIAIVTVNYLVHEYWDDVWNCLKGFPSHLGDFIQRTGTLNAQSLPPNQLFKLPEAKSNPFLSITPPLQQTGRVQNATPADTKSDPVFGQDGSSQQVVPYSAADREAKVTALAETDETKDPRLVRFQQSIRTYLEVQSAKNRYFQDLPLDFTKFEEPPKYKPGERGSLAVSYEGGRWSHEIKVNPFKAPEIAIPLLAFHLLSNQIRWHRLSPGDKALANFRSQMGNLHAAKKKDWLALPVLTGRLTSHSYAEIEHQCKKEVRKQIRHVIATHPDDPSVVTVFKALHWALENGDNSLFNNPGNEDYQRFVKSCNDDFNSKTRCLAQQVKSGDLVGAQKTVMELHKSHPYETGTHLMSAEVYIRQRNFAQARNEIKNAEIYDQRDQRLAQRVENKMVDNGYYTTDVRSECIQQARLVHQEVNQTKFRLHLAMAQSAGADKPTHLQNLFEHTQACLREAPDNVDYLSNQVEALLLKGMHRETIPVLEKICKVSPQPIHYFQLGSKYDELGELTNANKAYEAGLDHSQHLSDPKITHQVQCRVRDNYLLLKDHAKAFEYAKKAYNHNSTTRIDSYWYGILCVEQKEMKEAQTALEKFTAGAEKDSKKYPDLESDAHYLLGNIYFSQRELEKAETHFKKSLDLDPKNVEALISYGRFLYYTGHFLAAEKELQKALDLDAGNQKVKVLLRDCRHECLKRFGVEIFSRLLSGAFNHFVTHGNLSRNTRINLMKGRYVVAISHDLVSNKWRHGQFLPKNWNKMRHAQKTAYITQKFGLLFNLVDLQLEQWGVDVPQELRNGNKCIQTSAEAYSIYDSVKTIDWQDSSSVANAACLVATLGPDVLESLWRGGYRLYYGEYMPKLTNRGYLFVKNVVVDTGAVASIALSNPDAVAMLLTATPIPPDYAPYVFGGLAAIGIGAHAYNKSWYDKLNNLQHNASDALKENHPNKYDKAIGYLNECLTLKPNQETTDKIKKDIHAISEKRLFVEIEKIRSANKEMGHDETKEIIAAYDKHLKDVPNDETIHKQRVDLQLLFDVQSYIQQDKRDEAIQICQQCLDKDNQNVMALRCRSQLFLLAKEYELARQDAEVLRKLHPQDPTVHQQLANIELAAGNFVAARKLAEKAVQLSEGKSESKANAQKQLDVINDTISARCIRNLSQCIGSFLNVLADCYIASCLLEYAVEAKPHLSYWPRASLANPPEDELVLLRTGEFQMEESKLASIGEGSRDPDALTQPSNGEFQLKEGDLVSIGQQLDPETTLVRVGEHQLADDVLQTRVDDQDQFPEEVIMLASRSLDQFWSKLPDQRSTRKGQFVEAVALQSLVYRS